MGKAKKPKIKKSLAKPYAKARAKPPTSSKPKPITKQRSNGSKRTNPRPQGLPFEKRERILLVGEGDFSFSASLASHHAFTSLISTSYDSEAVVLQKYPQAIGHLSTLSETNQTVLFSIDATKLGQPGTPGGSALRRKPGFDAVVFNFPHVGGKSTDVNRQVRANQALVVAFLQGCLRVLAPRGKVVVTLFEGEPYELWGLRNLARHVGFGVERSFRFDAALYPGYRHARTLGNVEGQRAWRGEDREARMYVLRRKEEVDAAIALMEKKKKKRDEEDSTDSDEADIEIDADDGDDEDNDVDDE